ncbi:MAG: hypothetical protein H6574_21460 [Lewinellaceae bacterium]|nr:hypothetical protein [Saprospiraceae bacterium]MCB9316803.1 hypothetical protein [Lewinellaceae bacterium]MCB9333632.1 hypothetical protein [Lewinellaceae bacterium]
MKAYLINGILSAGMLLLFSTISTAQDVDPADSTGLPGDHFSLEGAIELFKKSASPEEFEKLLNTENNSVNNLDLNEDGEVDYIRVIDNSEGDVHAIVLQVPVNEKESQDIAVIEIEKQNDDFTILQIVGDEDIFGEETIAEPFEEEAGASEGRGGPVVHLKPYRIVVNVRLWPCVTYIYRPGYRIWVSPWRFAYYPTWYRPWRPRPWRVYYVGVRPYRRHYHVVTTHRVVSAHKVYVPRRSRSTVVHTRTTTTVAARRANGTVVGKRTTTTTTTTAKNRPAGRATTKQTTTTTKAGARQGKNGRAVGKKTTTTKTTVRRKRGG